MRRLVLIAAAPLLSASAPTLPSLGQADLRCYLAFDLLSEGKSKNAQIAGAIGSYYFLGRLDGRMPDLDLQATLTSDGFNMSLKDIPSVLRRCQKVLDNRRNQISDIQKRLGKSAD